MPGGNLLASIDSLSTFSSISTQLYTSRVPPRRLRDKVQDYEDSARAFGARWECAECAEIKSESGCGEEEGCPEPERACVTRSVFWGDGNLVQRAASHAKEKLMGLVNKVKSTRRGKLLEQDVGCLSVQVARSNLQALHAFLEACPQEMMGTCKNRVCRQKARLLVKAEKCLERGGYQQFLTEFKLMLCQIQGDGSELSSRVEAVRKRVEHIPRLSSEFQRLVALYCSEHGYLPSKGYVL